MLILWGVAIVIVGFAVRLNPLLVVVLAAIATGLLAGLSPLGVIAAFGKAFNDNRFVSAAYLVLPLVGVVERAGIREQAGRGVGGAQGASGWRLAIRYKALRPLTTAGGPAPTPRPAPTNRPPAAPPAA